VIQQARDVHAVPLQFGIGEVRGQRSPLALLVPGAVSTMIVTAILSRACKPHRRPDPVYDGDS
jgi:hypothetical protein